LLSLSKTCRCDTGIAAGNTDHQAQLTTQKNTTQQKPKLVASNITEKKLSVTDRLYCRSYFEFLRRIDK